MEQSFKIILNSIYGKTGQSVNHKIGNMCIMVKTTRTTHIKSGILYNKLKDVGKIEPYSKKINLNSDKKRNWFSELSHLTIKQHVIQLQFLRIL